MKITITGATGFVGQNLSEYLEEKGFTTSKEEFDNYRNNCIF